MIESILLDLLLILTLILLAAIGAYRGGLREAFSAAGVAVGALIAIEWTGHWGGWLADSTNLSDGGARFAVSVSCLVIVTALVGYGVGGTFNYHPGAGGRMFGFLLGIGGGLVAISYVLTWIREELYSGDEPDIIREAYVARYLDGDAGSMLLLVAGTVVIGALLGSMVRERDDDLAAGQEWTGVQAGTPSQRIASDTIDKVESPAVERHLTTPVQVQPRRTWDDRSGNLPQQADRQWSTTWPSDAPGVPPEERPSRVGEVQQARERRRGQRGDDATS